MVINQFQLVYCHNSIQNSLTFVKVLQTPTVVKWLGVFIVVP